MSKQIFKEIPVTVGEHTEVRFSKNGNKYLFLDIMDEQGNIISIYSFNPRHAFALERGYITLGPALIDYEVDSDWDTGRDSVRLLKFHGLNERAKGAQIQAAQPVQQNVPVAPVEDSLYGQQALPQQVATEQPF